MAFEDWKYKSRHPTVFRFSRKVNWQKRLLTAGTVVVVVSTAIWLIRDTVSLIGDYGPSAGSLVVNINTATQKQLETVPGIGPTRAVQIIAGRPYESVDELIKVVGIGNASLDGLRPFVTTEGDTRKR